MNLRDQTLIRHEASARVRQASGEEVPRQESCVGENRIWNFTGGYSRQLTEEKGEDDHHEYGLDHSPGYSQDRLLVADLDIPPDEEV